VAVCDMALHGRVDASNGDDEVLYGEGRRLESGVGAGKEALRRSRGCHSGRVRDV
jgi:hypothetical protein